MNTQLKTFLEWLESQKKMYENPHPYESDSYYVKCKIKVEAFDDAICILNRIIETTNEDTNEIKSI